MLAVVESRQRRQQPLRVGHPRLAEDLIGVAVLDHISAVHHQDVLAELGDDAEVVGDQDNRGAGLLLQVVHQLEHLRLDGNVQRRGRLVGDQELRVTRQSHGDHHALAHAAGKLMGIVAKTLFRSRNAHFLEHLDGAIARLPLSQVQVQPHRLGDLFADRQHRVERGHRILEDHRDLIAANLAHLALALVGQVLPEQFDAIARDGSRCRPANA